MKSFDEYKLTSSDEYQAVLGMIQFLEYIDNDYQETLSEGILDKFGLSAKKEDGGLIKIVKDAGLLMAKLFAAALKGDKETVKEIANTEIKKEDVLNFLLKLDQATLHLLTGPIHSIEAITGWTIWTKVDKTTSTTISTIKDATKYIKDRVSNINDKAAKKIHAAASAIEKLAKAPTIQE